jgi:hypothetical protein
MIRNCARAGDHPALQSGLALANAIRQLVDEPARRISRSNLTAVGGAALAPAGAERGPASPAPPRPTPVTGPAVLASSPFTAPPPEQPHRDARRRRVLMAAVVALAVVATAAIVTLTGRVPAGDSGVAVRVRVSVPTRCGDEPLAPPRAVAVAAEPAELRALCLDDAQEFGVLARVDDSLVLARRRSARGARFDEAATVVAEGVREVGTAVSGPAGWAAWIARSGPVFGLARVDRQVHRVAVSTPGLAAASFRGALLLRADATGAWIGTTYLAGGRERDAAVYLIDDGAAVAAIPGDPATLLVRATAAGRTTYTAVSMPLNTLAGLSSNAAGDGGATVMRELSPQVLLRSSPWVAPEGAVRFALLGAGAAGSSRRFLATVDAGGDAACEGEACDGSGPVLVVEFPPRGEAVAREIERHGRGQMISAGVSNSVVAAVTRASDGALMPYLIDVGGEVRAQHWVLGGLDHAAVATCGDEPWLAFAQGSPQLRLGAIPLACALR